MAWLSARVLAFGQQTDRRTPLPRTIAARDPALRSMQSAEQHARINVDRLLLLASFGTKAWNGVESFAGLN